MSDEQNDTKNVVDLHAVRERREHERGHELHEQGSAFMFLDYDFDDEGVGLLDDTDRVISVLHDPENLKGFCMTPEDAVKLGVALIQAASSPFIDECLIDECLEEHE